MKEYKLKITNTPPTDWSDIERARVDSYVWGGAERAYETYGQLSYAKTGDEKSGLYVHLFCDEKNPVSSETKPNGMVCKDSCMEFFFSMHPEEAENTGYINFECNSLGISRTKFGEGRHGRVFLDTLGIERFPVSVKLGDEGWELFVFIPESALRQIFGLSLIDESTVMRGNFYKCDENAGAPFGSWSPIVAPAPDFHRPEYFGRITITR